MRIFDYNMDHRMWSFDSEDWAPFGLMDPTLGGLISTPEEATAVRQFVQAYNTPMSLASDEAARRLMTLNEDHIPCDGPLDKGERVSRLLWGVALVMPQYQTAVLVLVDSVRALPRLEPTPEQKVRFGEKLEKWRKLDSWDDVSQELWFAHRFYRYPRDRIDSPNTSLWWLRASAFMARYLVLHPPDLDYPFQLAKAIEQIQFTLEYDPWNCRDQLVKFIGVHGGQDLTCHHSHELHITMLNTNILGIVPFLELAGPTIYQFTDKDTWSRKLVEAGREKDQYNVWLFWEFISVWNGYDFMNPSEETEGPGMHDPECHLWRHDFWYTRDRWAFWKQRLVWVSEQKELLQRTRDEALKIVHRMQIIEAQAREHILD